MPKSTRTGISSSTFVIIQPLIGFANRNLPIFARRIKNVAKSERFFRLTDSDTKMSKGMKKCA
jgi:hypothetical protein